MSGPTYPGGGGKVTTDASQKQPKRLQKALRPFQGVVRAVTRPAGRRKR